MKLPVVLIEEGGRFEAQIPVLSGCVCYGDTIEDVVSHIAYVAHDRLVNMVENGRTLPSEYILTEVDVTI